MTQTVEHRLVLELLRVIREMDGGSCLTRLLFDRPDDEIEALMAAIKEVQGVPEVEVTDSLTRSASLRSVGDQERPLESRRSGAKNVSPPHLQNAFIDEARLQMGQPSKDQAEALVGTKVILYFNDDTPATWGKLTSVTTHPSGNMGRSVYVVLDDDETRMFPLNAVQRIEASDA